MAAGRLFNLPRIAGFYERRSLSHVACMKKCSFNRILSKKCNMCHSSSLYSFHANQRICKKFYAFPVVFYCTSSPSSVEVDNVILKIKEIDVPRILTGIKEEINTVHHELKEITNYFFNLQGKAFRPLVLLLMAQTCNFQTEKTSQCLLSQEKIAMVAEMIHAAGLIHDDVLDGADTRRGMPSINFVWGQRKAIFVGDYIMSVIAKILSRLKSPEVVIVLSQAIEDLVRGEIMQLGSQISENDRFAHYLEKSYKKSASLVANSCKAIAMLAGCTEEVIQIAFEYGKNFGIAFQLIDDMLDFVSDKEMMGKPTATDLKLGLATAPVLFACEKYPELNALIMRRFSEPGDIEKTWEAVQNSDSLDQTLYLAKQYSNEAIKQIKLLKSSPEQNALIYFANKTLTRLK